MSLPAGVHPDFDARLRLELADARRRAHQILPLPGRSTVRTGSRWSPDQQQTVRIPRRRSCVGCGCPHDQRTPGCGNCGSRHAMRQRQRERSSRRTATTADRTDTVASMPSLLRGTTDLLIMEQIDEHGPLTATEIADRLLTKARQEWAAEEGLEIQWGDATGRGPNEPLGARLLAASRGRKRGFVYHQADVYSRLVSLEKRGIVDRITPPGGRGILWRRR